MDKNKITNTYCPKTDLFEVLIDHFFLLPSLIYSHTPDHLPELYGKLICVTPRA